MPSNRHQMKSNMAKQKLPLWLTTSMYQYFLNIAVKFYFNKKLQVHQQCFLMFLCCRTVKSGSVFLLSTWDLPPAWTWWSPARGSVLSNQWLRLRPPAEQRTWPSLPPPPECPGLCQPCWLWGPSLQNMRKELRARCVDALASPLLTEDMDRPKYRNGPKSLLLFLQSLFSCCVSPSLSDVFFKRVSSGSDSSSSIGRDFFKNLLDAFPDPKDSVAIT